MVLEKPNYQVLSHCSLGKDRVRFPQPLVMFPTDPYMTLLYMCFCLIHIIGSPTLNSLATALGFYLSKVRFLWKTHLLGDPFQQLNHQQKALQCEKRGSDQTVNMHHCLQQEKLKQEGRALALGLTLARSVSGGGLGCGTAWHTSSQGCSEQANSQAPDSKNSED